MKTNQQCRKMIFLLFLACVFLAVTHLRAHELHGLKSTMRGVEVGTNNVPAEAASGLIDPACSAPIELLQDDSTQAKPHIKLLPDHLSPMESILWGEHGVMRSTGILPLTPGARKTELSVRRTMLTAHQIGGFITIGLFIPTLILGQQNINMWNGVAAGTRAYDRDLDNRHRNIAMLTWGTYMTTAALSIFSPPPLIRRDEGGTTSIHKTLAWIHFTGMIAIPILGALGSSRRDFNSAKGYRTAHQIVAYTSAAALTASMIVMTF